MPSGDFVSVVVFHIVCLDVRHLMVDGFLDGVDIANLPTTVDLIEMLHHIAVDNLFGIDDLAVDALVGGALYAYGRQLFFEIGNILLLFGHNDFYVVGGMRGEDEVDIFKPDIDSGRCDLLNASFQNEMPLGIGLPLGKENAGFVDEVFVREEPHQSVGFIAPSCNRHILGVCRKEEQG